MIIAAVVIGALVAIGLAVMVWVRRAVHRSKRVLDAVVAGRQVIAAENALSLGVASGGKRQFRGSGTLALCHDRVMFVQWVPSSVLEVSVVDVTAVDTPTAHLGRSVGAPLLRIAWMTSDGADEVAFQVRDLDRWTTALAQLTN